MTIRYRAGLVLLVLAGAGLGAVGQGTSVEPLLQKIKAVGKEGQGSVAAVKAVQQLTAQGTAALLPVLAALDDANPVAANYLRAAAETIADKALAAKKKLPAKELETFALDT